VKGWPIYYKDFLTISDKKSNIGICTLWTPKDSICSKLDKKSFSVGGQLYSKRGVNFILRNVLANPLIDHIILCGSDRSESGEAFLKFMKNGVDKNYRVKGDEKCEIHKEIGRKSLEKFRKSVKLVDMRGKVNLSELRRKIRLIKQRKRAWARAKKFKESKLQAADKFPSEKSTFNVRADYVWEAWVQILRLIMKFGSKKGMIKIGEVKELVNVIAVIDKEDPYEPELSDIFDFNKKDIKLYFKDFYSPKKGGESYNYGERLYAYPVGLPIGTFNSKVNAKLFHELEAKGGKRLALRLRSGQARSGLDQLEEIYEKYKRYHDDRGLVAAIWNPWVDNVKSGWMSDKKSQKSKIKNRNLGGNVPCMVLLQFTYRSKKLHLTAYFRSNDMFDAWPRNAFALRKLQLDFAKRIGKKPGYLTTISNCAQIYETNYKEAEKIIQKHKESTFCMPDVRGTVIIEVKNKEIMARHMSEDGNVQLEEFSIDGTLPKAALKLMDILEINNVFSDRFHVADIAIELSKAEWCVKNRVPFIQDKDWGELRAKSVKR
jgi:thymidylate synthase